MATATAQQLHRAGLTPTGEIVIVKDGHITRGQRKELAKHDHTTGTNSHRVTWMDLRRAPVRTSAGDAGNGAAGGAATIRRGTIKTPPPTTTSAAEQQRRHDQPAAAAAAQLPDLIETTPGPTSKDDATTLLPAPAPLLGLVRDTRPPSRRIVLDGR